MVSDQPFAASNFSALTSPNDQVRFDLHKKAEEIREITAILKDLSTKGRDERRHWLQENEDLVTGLAEDFVDDSLYSLDGVQLDSETLELSVEVMTELKKTLGLFQTVIGGQDDLEA